MLDLQLLKNMTGTQKYEKDAVIVREGDAGDEMYIILKGQAGVYKNYKQPNEIQAAALGPGDFFGEMELFLGKQQRTATVVARDEVMALGVSLKNVFEFLRRQPEITFSLIATLCARLDGGSLSHENLYKQSFGGAESEAQTQAHAQIQTPSNSESLSTAGSNAGKAVKQAESKMAEPKADEPKTAEPKTAEPKTAEPSKAYALFPEGHSNYLLPIDNTKTNYLYERAYTCPICGHAFKDFVVRASRLINVHTDPDMRAHYKDIEPLHYDVVACPNCLYSALSDVFAKASLSQTARNTLEQNLVAHRGEIRLQTGAGRDTFTVFAGYYLALICAPICFRYPELTTGKLWVKLSRIYTDCGDEVMSRYANGQALKDYLVAYEKASISRPQALQVCMLIGELNYKLGDINAARKFFFQAKTDKEATNLIKRQCESRLEDIRMNLKG